MKFVKSLALDKLHLMKPSRTRISDTMATGNKQKNGNEAQRFVYEALGVKSTSFSVYYLLYLYALTLI